jgi:diguanylate cyclase (GGDEF)-like protein
MELLIDIEHSASAPSPVFGNPKRRAATTAAAQPASEMQIAATGQPQVTVSIGVAEALVQLEEPDSVIRRADAALYRAKQAGRNRVISATSLVAA